MLRAKDAKSVAEYLMGSEYASSLEAVSAETPRAPHLTRAFYSLLVRRCYRLVDIAPGATRRFLEAYLERFLVEDVKRVLREKQGGGPDKARLIEIPDGYDFVGLQALSEAPTVEEAVESLERTRFRGVAGAMETYQKYNLISILEGSLDKIYFDSEVRPNIAGLPRSSGIEEIVTTESDLVNIRTITDLRARGVATDVVRDLSLTSSGLEADAIARLSEAKVDSIPRILVRTRYAGFAQQVYNVLDPAKGESLDHVVRAEIRRLTKPLVFRFALSPGYVLGYMKDSESEAENLAAIATGKELGLAESRIDAALSL